MTNVKVFDTFLPLDSFRAFNAFARAIEKRPTRYGASIWQRNNENPLESQRLFCSTGQAGVVDQALPSGLQIEELRRLSDLALYPTKTPVDLFFEGIWRRASELEEVVGRFGRQWVALSGRIFAYPRGAKATWHTDSSLYAGALVYYAHEQWHKNWGGQLLYSDRTDSEEDAFGEGHFVAPVPNRLVVLRAGTPHTVANVSQAAEDSVRLTFSPFLVPPGGISKLLETAQEERRLDQADVG